ncbi:MAG: hypothetical protein PHE24_05505 [Patescibacteria group bacterium]|nr:hypothetical protein [Patescibacteria group bacterium]
MLEEKKPSKIWLKILLVAFYLFVFAVLLNNSFGYLDPDFGWHLKMGEQIWQTRAVPDINYEDYTLSGTRWVDHEWLPEIFVYLVYHYFGYIALSVFFALLIVAALIIQLAFTRKFFLTDDRGLFFVLILQAFGTYASLPLLGVRVQEITILCLLLLAIIIYLYQRNKNYRLLVWLIPLFIFWASAHGGFLVGFFVLGLFALVKAGELWSAKKFPVRFIDYRGVLNLKQIGSLAGFSFLALAATLATPYGYRLHLFLLGCRDSFYQIYLGEWQSQYSYPFVFPQLGYLEIVLIFLALLFFAAFFIKGGQRRKIDLYQTILVIFFAALAFKARRHFPLLFIVSLPIISCFFINFFALKPEPETSLPMPAGNARLPGKRKINIALKNLSLAVLTLALLAGAGIFIFRTPFTATPEKNYQDQYPYQAVAFLQAHPEWNDLKIFNDYGWGGYLIWQYPERKLFIDGRLPEYPMRGRTALEEYKAFFDPEQMIAQMQYYDIGLVLISPKEDYPKIPWWEIWYFNLNMEQINSDIKKSFSFLEYLRASPRWRSVYNDGLAEIFVRQTNQ